MDTVEPFLTGHLISTHTLCINFNLKIKNYKFNSAFQEKLHCIGNNISRVSLHFCIPLGNIILHYKFKKIIWKWLLYLF